MSLLPSWVDRLFQKLTLTYGQAFLRQYDGVPLEDVKANWGYELDGISAESIAYALKYLPAERPPSVLQFRDNCRRAPVKAPLQIEHRPGPVDPEVIGKAKAIVQPVGAGSRAWAQKLKRREESGERLSITQRKAWRDALGVECARQEGVEA